MPNWTYIIAALLGFAVIPASAQDAQLMPVPVRSIFAGEVLTETDFAMKLFKVNDGLRKSYVFEPYQFDRMEAVRTLAAGKPVPLRFIKIAEDVRKGQPTKALYSSTSIEIQGILVPLSGGSVGQTIEARNPVSGGIVRAIVNKDGTLLVVAK